MWQDELSQPSWFGGRGTTHPEGDGPMPNLKSIDTIFSEAVASKTMPGIVAVAASDKGGLYEGAFGKRQLGKDAPMTLETVVWTASMPSASVASSSLRPSRSASAARSTCS